MKRHAAGTMVDPGLYVSGRPFGVKVVSCRPGLLDGPRGTPFVRIPTVAIPFVAILALVVGGVWVVLFPVVGTAMIVVSAAERVWRSIARAASDHASSEGRTRRRLQR